MDLGIWICVWKCGISLQIAFFHMDTGDEPIDLESEDFRGTNPVQITPYDFGPGFWFIALWRLISVYGGSSYLNSNLSFFNGGPGGPVNRVDYLEIFQKIMKPGCWIFSEKRRLSSDLQQAPGTPGALHSPGHRLKNGEEISSRMPVVQNTAFLVSTRFNHI